MQWDDPVVEDEKSWWLHLAAAVVIASSAILSVFLAGLAAHFVWLIFDLGWRLI